MRLYDITRDEAIIVCERPATKELDWRGNPRLTAEVGGREITVVIAGDAPGTVITLWEVVE